MVVPLHERHDDARVDAPREQGADRHVGHHARADRVGERRLDPVRRLTVVDQRRLRQCRVDGGVGRPVGHGLGEEAGTGPGAEGHLGTGDELGQTPVDALRRRHAAQAEELGDGVAVDDRARTGGMAWNAFSSDAKAKRPPVQP